MKRPCLCLLVLCAIFASNPAAASLRSLGTITEIGLTDDNPLHVAIVLGDGSPLWEAIHSQDGGEHWTIAQRAALPETLRKLPTDAEVRYLFIENKYLLISSDSGITWKLVSPWSYLNDLTRISIEAEKSRFMVQYGALLPNDDWWPIIYISSVGMLIGSIASLLWRQKKTWLMPSIATVCCYLFLGLGLFMFGQQYFNWMCYLQWDGQMAHEQASQLPLWPLGLMLHFTGNSFIAPITAMICFPLTPLYSKFCELLKSPLRQKIAYWTGVIVVVAFASFIATVPFIGRGFQY